MKKIVQGKQLNTETAKIVGIAMIDEEKDIVEALYQTKSGAYFIHNVYRKSTTGKLETVEDIYLITADEAQQWAKQWLTSSEYDGWFGSGIINETVKITVNISGFAYNILKHQKEKTGDTYGDIITHALELM